MIPAVAAGEQRNVELGDAHACCGDMGAGGLRRLRRECGRDILVSGCLVGRLLKVN